MEMDSLELMVNSTNGPKRKSSFPKAFVFGIGIIMALSQPVETSQKQVAIIVHPSNNTSTLSLNELERVLRLNRTRWNNGQKIYLLLQEEGSLEKEVILKKVYRMTSDELKRFWLTKIYRGEMTSFPKTLSSNESIRRFVSRVPNAIGFVDASYPDETVKVLRIDGKLPGAEGYALGEEVQ